MSISNFSIFLTLLVMHFFQSNFVQIGVQFLEFICASFKDPSTFLHLSRLPSLK